MRRALDRAGVSLEEVDAVVPHQANERIISAAARRLGIDGDRVMLNIATHGNSAAASVPMALADALENGLIGPGSVVVQTAFGAGVTWGSAVNRWGERVTPLGSSDAELPACDQSVFELLASNRDFYAPLHSNAAGEAAPRATLRSQRRQPREAASDRAAPPTISETRSRHY